MSEDYDITAYETGTKAWKAGEQAVPPLEWTPVKRAFWAWGWLNEQQRFNSQFPKGDAKRRIETVDDQL